MAARLQRMARPDHPVLLRVRDNVGHNLASDTDWVECDAEELAFLVAVLGLEIVCQHRRPSSRSPRTGAC